MAAGEFKSNGWTRRLKILEGVTAANGAPSGSLAGHTLANLVASDRPRYGTIVIANSAGTGTLGIASARLWVWDSEVADWIPPGTGDGPAKAIINDGLPFTNTGTDKIRHAEIVELPGMFSKVYLELGAITGTGAAFDAWLRVYDESQEG